MTDSIAPAPVWKRGLAATLDAFTAFFGFGWLIGHFTGNTTDKGFNLDGGPALLLFAIVVAYFSLAAATPAARFETASSASAGRSRKHRRYRHKGVDGSQMRGYDG